MLNFHPSEHRRRRHETAVDQKDKYIDMVMRSKYQRLYTYLRSLQVQARRTSFREIEAVVGFELPPSARLHRPWW